MESWKLSWTRGPWTMDRGVVDRGPWTVDRGPWTVDRGMYETLTSYIYGYEDDGAWEGLSPTGRPRLGRGLDLPWRGPGQPDTYQ